MSTKLYKTNLIVFVVLVIGLVLMVLMPSKAFAVECEEIYGGGERCIYNKSFEITKKVRIKDVGSYKDRLNLDEDDLDEVLEFKIKVKNIGEVEVDNMEMEDELPDGLTRVGGDDLEESWNDFEPGEAKEYKIRVEIDEDVYEDKDSFETCLVNKAQVKYDGHHEGSDIAEVCFGVGEPVELPDTGADATAMTGIGLGLIFFGVLLKRLFS